MTVVNEYSPEFLKATDPRTNGALAPEKSGQILRFLPFAHTQLAAGTTGSDVVLARLPAGRVIFFPHLSRISCSAQGTSGDVGDIGYKAYTGEDGVAVVAALDVFDADIAMENAYNGFMGSDHVANPAVPFNSTSGVDIIITLAITSVEVGETINGYLVYAVVGA